jgi:hypothetical protein
MAQGREEFERQLRDLGFNPEPEVPEPRVVFGYAVTAGRFKGQNVRLGFEIPPNFPLEPPPGPHVSPRLLPINTAIEAHPTKVAESQFGSDWEYWSRPRKGWKGRETVGMYLLHIDHLFATIP